MPNHFHFLLKQTKDSGIKEFIRLMGNSYAKYFNAKYRRKGSLFESRFKAVRIETDEQLFHVSRYIHLNPYSGFVVKTLNQLIIYPFSSLPEYLSKTNNVCHQEHLWGQFSSPAKYKQFILDQADYQRTLQGIKHQLMEN
jgi:putative transposase